LSAGTAGNGIITALYEDESSMVWVGARSDILLLWDKKTGKQYSIKRMTGGRVIEANTDFYRYLICHLPSAGV